MTEIAVTDELLDGLARKLRALDLTDAEQAVLGTIMATSAAAVSDVEPYGVVFEIETTFKGSDEELQVALKRATGGLSVWTDMRPLSVKTGE